MEYTAPVAISRGLAVASPTHPVIASANGNVLQLHDLNSNALLKTLITAAPITHITWSPKSSTSSVYLAVASRGGNVVITDIDANPIADVHDGLLQIAWLALADPHRLIIGYEHGLGIAIFDIDHPDCKLLTFIPFAIRPAALPPCMAATRLVSPCAKLAALVVHDGKLSYDMIIVVRLEDSRVLCKVSTDAFNVQRVAGLKWASDSALIVWGRPSYLSSHHRMALVSINGVIVHENLLRAIGDGESKGEGEDYDDENNGVNRIPGEEEIDRQQKRITKHSRRKEPSIDEKELGVRICATAILNRDSGSRDDEKFKPISIMGAFGGYDGYIYLVDMIRGRLCKRFSHGSPEVDDANCAPLVFRENRHIPVEAQEAGGYDCRGNAEFDVVQWAPEIDIGNSVNNSSKAISWVEFSNDGSLFASRDVKTPNVVLIWDVKAVRLAVVMILSDSVVNCKWCGGKGQTLSIGCGGPWVYLWEQRGAAAVGVGCDEEWGSKFEVRKVSWAHDDSALVLVDGSSARAFVTMYPS